MKLESLLLTAMMAVGALSASEQTCLNRRGKTVACSVSTVTVTVSNCGATGTGTGGATGTGTGSGGGSTPTGGSGGGGGGGSGGTCSSNSIPSTCSGTVAAGGCNANNQGCPCAGAVNSPIGNSCATCQQDFEAGAPPYACQYGTVS